MCVEVYLGLGLVTIVPDSFTLTNEVLHKMHNFTLLSIVMSLTLCLNQNDHNAAYRYVL